MIPFPQDFTRIAQQRHAELLAEAARQRLSTQSRWHDDLFVPITPSIRWQQRIVAAWRTLLQTRWGTATLDLLGLALVNR